VDKDCVVIVTGANSGIGKAVALELTRLGAHVVMVCRSAERGEKALFDIRAKTGGSAELMICDLASLKSVEDFCDRFIKKHKRLDVLVNNAGTLFGRRCQTPDGFESNFQVNFLGAFLLTNRLLPLLKESAPSRIVNVSSIAHRCGKVRFDDINLEKGYNWWRGYAQSKLAIVMSTYALARELEGSGVSVNCIHPGIVATDIIVNRENGSGSLLARLQRMFFISPERAAEPIVRLAAAEEAEGITGRYFSRGVEKRSSSRSYDMVAGERLRTLCEGLCGLCGSAKEPLNSEGSLEAKETVP
jgi:NAD(P)-dependent dehydrogenase (short-subunit alcohol dehydrogenase family)